MSATPLPVVFGAHANAALIVEPDHEFGLVAIALAADRRCRIVVAPETALQLAHDLVVTVKLAAPGAGAPAMSPVRGGCGTKAPGMTSNASDTSR